MIRRFVLRVPGEQRAEEGCVFSSGKTVLGGPGSLVIHDDFDTFAAGLGEVHLEWLDGGNVTAEGMQRLEHAGYRWEPDQDVFEYLKRYPFLMPLLLEASPHLGRCFGDVPTILKVYHDPEDGSQELMVDIQTRLSPDALVEAVNAFDTAWWLDALDRADGKLMFYGGFAGEEPSNGE